MRIRFLAAAVVTAGTLMATLTGAANASDTPTPTPPDRGVAVTIVCGGPAGKGTVTVRKLAEAEMKDFQAKVKDVQPGDLKWEKSGEVTEAVPTTPALEAVPAMPTLPATPVPATPLDPSKPAMTKGVAIFPDEEGAARLDKLPEGIREGEGIVVFRAAPGTPMDETVAACPLMDANAEEAQAPEEPQASEEVQRPEEAGM